MSIHQSGLIGLHWLYDTMNFICEVINNGKFCNKLILRTYVNMCIERNKSSKYISSKNVNELIVLVCKPNLPNPLNLAMF